MLSNNVFSDKLLLMIASSYEKLRKLFPLLRVIKRHFFGFQDQKAVISSYLKCTKDCLKIVYYLIKCFFTRKLGIVVSIIAKCWIFSKWKDSTYEDVKKQGSKYETLCSTPDVIFVQILKQFPSLHLCFLFVRYIAINSKDKLSKSYVSSLAINSGSKWEWFKVGVVQGSESLR